MMRARRWAENLLRRDDLVILDTETTGVSRTDEVIQIGVVGKGGDVLLDTLVRPVQVTVSPAAQKVHGIKTADLAGAPTLAELEERLLDALQDKTAVVYNAAFDRRLLERSAWANNAMRLVRLFAREIDWQCAMETYAAYYGQRRYRRGGFKWQSLTAACEQQGIEVSGAHTAVGDAQMTLALLHKMAGVEVEV